MGGFGLYDELAPLHTHHEACGEPVLFDLDRQVFTSIYDGSNHACSTLAEDECDCGEPLLLSRFGRLRERDTGKPHFCELDVDKAEVDLAHGRGTWKREEAVARMPGAKPFVPFGGPGGPDAPMRGGIEVAV